MFYYDIVIAYLLSIFCTVTSFILIVRIYGSYQQLSTRRDYNDVICQPHRLRYVIGTLAADVIDLVREALAARFRVVGQQTAEIGENDVVGLCGGKLD